jgi:hypothetical protein
MYSTSIAYLVTSHFLVHRSQSPLLLPAAEGGSKHPPRPVCSKRARLSGEGEGEKKTLNRAALRQQRV